MTRTYPKGIRRYHDSDRALRSKIHQEGECWIWTGSSTSSGKAVYGRITVKGRTRLVHRFAYELWVGPIPKGLTLDHLCRQPLCINPGHLEPVTYRENILRGQGPPGRNHRKKRCSRGHPLEGVNLRLHTDKRGYVRRICRTCARDRAREWRQLVNTPRV